MFRHVQKTIKTTAFHHLAFPSTTCGIRKTSINECGQNAIYAKRLFKEQLQVNSIPIKRYSKAKKKGTDIENDTQKMKIPNTPMMKQYQAIKEKHSEHILFFRMGDFYEIFFEDAEICSKHLGLVLTHRHGVPMCGIPYHALQGYIQRLLGHQCKIAICDQVEDPKEAKKKKKPVVEREVTRIITPGTVTEDNLLRSDQNSYLMSIIGVFDNPNIKKNIGVSWYDMSTGECHVSEIPPAEIPMLIQLVNPREIITQEELLESTEYIQGLKSRNKKNNLSFSSPSCDIHAPSTILYELPKDIPEKTKSLFKDITRFSSIELLSILNLINYSQYTHQRHSLSMRSIEKYNSASKMRIDAFTRRSLEIVKTLGGEKTGSLLHTIDKTRTPHGSRLLASRLASPLTNVEEIGHRYDHIESLLKETLAIDQIQSHLKEFSDVERIMQRLLLSKEKQTSSIHPQQLTSIANTILSYQNLLSKIETTPYAQQHILPFMNDHETHLTFVLDEINKTIDESCSHTPIREGVSPIIDKYRNLLTNGSTILKELEEKYRKETDIKGLKISFTKVYGYAIQVPRPKVSEDFLKRVESAKTSFRPDAIQRLKNHIRFKSDELSELQFDLERAEAALKDEERILISKLVEDIIGYETTVFAFSNHLAELDVVTGLAALALERNFVRPTLVDADKSSSKTTTTTYPTQFFDIKGGRHPVVEHVQRGLFNFSGNDCNMDDSYFWCITGPNMGGKSTFLRQNALIILLAQMGSFVPATEATFSVVDALFSRVGAHDSLIEDQSTFMVEMVETASILHHATNRSFLILDEIGRGTSTEDGMALAQSIGEYIHDCISARTLFATHYRDLAASKFTHLDKVQYHHMKVDHIDDRVVFAYKLIPGIASHSYGIHVASLAGLPNRVIERANALLNKK